MKTRFTRHGFTIIEVMLFLAITGALSVAILAGSNIAIGQQRYRDSVASLKGLIQEQYSQVNNVVNTGVSGTKNPTCQLNSTTLKFGDIANQERGTSECLVLGRFLLITPVDDAASIPAKATAYNVIGDSGPAVSIPAPTSDFEALNRFTFSLDSPNSIPEETLVSWGADIVRPKTTQGMTLGILILKSPFSGMTMTFTQELNADDEDMSASLKPMINSANMETRDICVDPRGTVALGSRRAVRINAYAAGQSAVEIPLEEGGICD